MAILDNFRKAARRWIRALRAGDSEALSRIRQAYPDAPAVPTLRDVQHALAREHGHQSWIELRQYLNAVSNAPDLRRFERLAADILLAYHTGDSPALRRFNQTLGESITLEDLRTNVNRGLQRLGSLRSDEQLTLAHVRLLIARHAGFETWPAFVEALQLSDLPTRPSGPVPMRPAAEDTMQPVELRSTFPMELQDGQYSTTTEVWKILTATRAGDLATVKKLAGRNPALVTCEHNYMPPLQLAVREGHTEVVEYLLQHGAYDPKFVTYPYNQSIHLLAEDRNFDEIARLLQEHGTTNRPTRASVHGAGHIDFSTDPMNPDRIKLEKLVNADALHAVEKLGETQPGLIHDPLLFWGEGVLSSPCNSRRANMIDLLLRLGARVPDVAKWAPFYYFKHLDIAERLLAAGMNPNHMNWHRTTLLHHIAWEGNLQKAILLLNHGTDPNAVDDEFRSTPLGMAANAGRGEMVSLLLQRGADPNKAGAPWATPLAWARKRGNVGIESDLRAGGAG